MIGLHHVPLLRIWRRLQSNRSMLPTVEAVADATTANAVSTAARRGGMGGNLLNLNQCRTPAAADTSGST
jgi:hypothetical protein